MFSPAVRLFHLHYDWEQNLERPFQAFSCKRLKKRAGDERGLTPGSRSQLIALVARSLFRSSSPTESLEQATVRWEVKKLTSLSGSCYFRREGGYYWNTTVMTVRPVGGEYFVPLGYGAFSAPKLKLKLFHVFLPPKFLCTSRWTYETMHSAFPEY